MVQKLFWDNPYRTQLETCVCTVDNNQVTVESTIFYAFSGGQESDTGFIGGNRVLEAKKYDLDIVYTVEDNHGLKPGGIVIMTIDWERRYKLMRLHFAAELVLELMYRKFPGIEKIGAHIAQDKSRIDFIWTESLSIIIQSLQQESQKLIDSNLPIISAFSDESTQKRYWKIDGFGQVPCGGTHIRSTGEIGKIQLKRVNPGKGKERIEIYVQ